MASLFKRVWALVSKPTRFIGRDLEGNAFFEYPSLSDDPSRTKRMVEYRPASRKWDYIGGNKRLPVQWTQWLTHTRHDPPTIEELQADIQRRQRVQHSVLLLEEEYKAERAANVLLPEPSTRDKADQNTSPLAIKDQSTNRTSGDITTSGNGAANPSSKKERMLIPPSSPLPPPETKPWSPKTARRG